MCKETFSKINRGFTYLLIALATANLAMTFVLWATGNPPKPTPYWMQALGELSFLTAWLIVLNCVTSMEKRDEK